MVRSKLEIYLGVLEVLALRGPLKLTHITYKAKVNHNVLKRHLNFLIKQNLVEERISENTKVVYAITKGGWKILRYFWEIKQVLQIEQKGV